MGVAGNSTASDERRRLQIAMQGGSPDRILRAARGLQERGELDLGDAARITAVLAEREDPRYPRAAALLAARLTIAGRLDLEALDRVLDLVGQLPDPERMSELLRYCRYADEGTAPPGGLLTDRER